MDAFYRIVWNFREELDSELEDLYDPDSLMFWTFTTVGSEHLKHNSRRRRQAGTVNEFFDEGRIS